MGEYDGHRARLRQRFLTNGLDALPDHEVLELLLFYAIPRKDTNPLSRRLLNHFGSISAVLEAPLSRRYQLSRSDKGICLSSTNACGEYLLPYFFGAQEELVYMLCLDAKCKVLTCRLLQTGSVNAASISLRKAAEIAMACKASSVVLAHNHTSGLALPSKADIETTILMKNALEPLGILLVDHIIVADNDFVSMADNGVF